MEPGAGSSASGSQVGTRDTDDVASKRARGRNEGSGLSSRKRHRRDKRRMKQRRTKKLTNQEAGEKTERDEREAEGSQTPETQQAASQAEGKPQGGAARMVSAQTQTQKRKGTTRGTQTTVARCHKGTQTPEPRLQTHSETPDEDGASESAPEQSPKLQEPESEAPEQSPKLQEPESEAPEQSPKLQEPESEAPEQSPKLQEPESGAPTDPQAENAARPMSYARVVSGDGSRETSTDAAQSQRSPAEASPAEVTLHIYAVLDRRFHFSPDRDQLVLRTDGASLPLRLRTVVARKHGGCVVEGTVSVEQRALPRGVWIPYWYSVKKQRKEVSGMALRKIQIPPHCNELHLYEGLIGCDDKGLWKVGLQLLGLGRPQAVEVSDAWLASAGTLLDRIFQDWTPSHPPSTQSLCENLKAFSWSLGSAHERMEYVDGSRPPRVQTQELISETLVQILDGRQTERIPGGCRNTSPLVLGLSIFTVTRQCDVNLGATGWAALCQLVSSDAAMDEKDPDALAASFRSPQHTVLGLINVCAHNTVPELVLLVPLLFGLRQPGADAAKVGPTVEEHDWCGLTGVDFTRFRQCIESLSDKRQRMLDAVRSRLPRAADAPLVLLGWASLVAFEDLPQFSEQTGMPAEHLIQSLLYRLRAAGDSMRTNVLQHNVEKTLSHVLVKVDKEKDGMIESGNIKAAFLSSLGVFESTCRVVRLVQSYQAAVLSYQLVLRLAETFHAALMKQCDEGEFESSKQQLLETLQAVQQGVSEWRDHLLHRPLLTAGALSYPKEVQMWDALIKVECSVGEFSSGWKLHVKKDLQTRISKLGEEDRVLVCCLHSTLAAIAGSHELVQTCFHDLCRAAIGSICQRRREGDLMRSLGAKVKDLPCAVLSAVVVESAARFGDDSVAQLLDPQSAMNHLLSHGAWQSIQVDDSAGQVVHNCVVAVQSLLESLLQGHVTLGQLQSCLKYREQFKSLHQQYKKNTTSEVPVDGGAVLAQREKDLNSFLLRKQQIETLTKMITKVTESITVRETSTLVQQLKADLQTTSLNQLVLVQSFDAKGELKVTGPPQVLWCNTSMNVLKMAKEMHRLHDSNLILSWWVKAAASVASAWQPTSPPAPVTLKQIYEHIWDPLMATFFELGVSIANADITFKQLDDVLEEAGDPGDGQLMRKELSLMSDVFSEKGQFQPEENWVELRLAQIQAYRQLCEAAAAASVILKITDKMKLTGSFSEIETLSQMEEESFRARPLRSLTEDLFRARRLLSSVTRQQTACLEEFHASQRLVHWVKDSLRNMSDVKVYVELASISAGENDTEIDQVACFHDAVMGYAPLLYSLRPQDGLEQFMKCARQVWDSLSRDEKLPDKLRESTRLLSWLRALKDTHGSVEQSSLSLAASINARGVYVVGWSDEHMEKRCLQNMVQVTVRRAREEKRYRLEDLVELQNKLMLMSSKGEHGRVQVSRFTEVFAGVRRVATILLRMQTSGNVLFRQWRAEVRCRPQQQQQQQQQQPSIQVTFLSLKGKEVLYYGEVTEQLQKLAQSMDSCQEKWSSFIRDMRCRFSLLNLYTAEQMVYLCHWIHKACQQQAAVPQQLWHLLFPVKPHCSLADVRAAFSRVNVKPEEEPEESESDNEDEYSASVEEVHDLMEFSSEDEGSDAMKVCDHPPHDIRRPNDDTLETLWRHFKKDMSLYLKEHLDISTLARFLSCLSDMSQQHMIRNLPPVLQEGKPNLVLCSKTEVFTTVLSFYMKSPEQPLPSNDEVLVCREETSEEEVEIFLRRALSQNSRQNCQKIYSLVNPGLLGYDVSVALGDFFEALERSANPQYRLVIVSPVVHQHKYVPSFFSSDKAQAGESLSVEAARKYLRYHFTQSTIPQVSPAQPSVWMVSSVRAAVGKSLLVDRLFEKFRQKCPRAQHIRIRLIEPSVDVDSLVKNLSEKLAPLRDQDPVLLHIDTAGVRSGLEELLFRLLVLGCVSDSHGLMWRRNTAHLITVELLKTKTPSQSQTKFGLHTQTRLGLLDILPTIHCRSPKELISSPRTPTKQTFDPLMDHQEFCSEAIQRPYQYLKLYRNGENLDRFKYQDASIVGDPIDCVTHFLSYCGMRDPSWAELKNFSWFLNVQLKDCENWIFCDADFLADNLPGFKNFIVKFMILMAKDFASPSLNTSDQSPVPHVENDLVCLTVRKHWENESHPYMFFNHDRSSMSFLGFNVKPDHQNILNAVDPRSNRVLIRDVMSQGLFEGLVRQRICLTEDFDQLPRADKIKRISRVVGAEGMLEKGFDPDPTYEITADNVMKMLAIHMRFRCGIPVVIMGETGCGKTRLVRFLCALQGEGRPVENMVLVKVHGGTTAEMIYRKVREAEILAEKNRTRHNLDTILFLDEANTTEAIFAIKEILCDRSVKGEPLKEDSGLKIIAACNPYRKHSPEMVERLERAGLGYRVKADETEDRLGRVPLRQLVYRVHPLPPSMASLVWDFGQLSASTERSYINQIVQKNVDDHGLPRICSDIISGVLAASQLYMRSRKNECSFVSLRDVERSLKVLVWFYQHSGIFFSNCSPLNEAYKTLRCLIRAVAVCYYPSLVAKEEYLNAICGYFTEPLNSSKALQEEISSCQDFFLENIKTRETIAKNVALKENVFLMVVCIELRIPLFLVGKPGSSKSLAKTVVADAMQGQNSHCDLFKHLKQVHMVSFQCSPHSSPEGIIGTFRNCARFQKDKNMDEYVSVVVLDEIGLAEDSPQMPLKTLHPLLEDGCIDNEKPDPHMKVGFVGISNWALDPAKMNRGIFVSRWDPSEDELVETANGICSSSNRILLKIKHLFPSLAKAFLSICDKTSTNQFFGLRDYYSLVKMLFAAVKCTNQEPDGGQVVEAILRNFSGQPEGFDPVIFFQEVLQNLTEIPRPSTLQMVKNNLDPDTNQESRYLLLLTTNNAALHILQQQVFSKGDYAPEIVFGSGFPKDQEYAQICRNVNRVKTCMETGHTVILLNMQNLYESLYDALNQYYVYLSKQQYVDLGLGSHRVKCRVHAKFRLVVVEDQKKVYEHFPVPLINRLEKHRVDRSTDLEPWQLRVLHKLRDWVKEFSGDATEDFKLSDIFVGFHGDACASALLQALEGRAGTGGETLEDDPAPMEEGRGPTESLQSVSNGQNEVTSQEDHDLPDAADMETDQNKQEIMSAEKNDDKVSEGHGVENKQMSESEEMMETENRVGSAEENKEDQVFNSAKALLLNCATPDAVLRLRYSELSNQEKEKLQRTYFQHQHHHSLRDFLEDFMNTHQESSRFLEITTFSSLLTKSDVKVVAHALGLHTDRILLLSLHQFDTEVSFYNKMRSFLQHAVTSLHILLIQMDLEESHCSDELIASAKYCTMNYLTSLVDQTCWVIYIVKASRIPSQSQYIGFQGGVWHSVHIDDLRDSEDMSLNLYGFCGTLISSLLSPAPSELNERQETAKADRARLHSLSLLTSCIQKAVGLLRDPDGLTPRSMQRVHVLLGLLRTGPSHIRDRFQQVLLSRLAEVLARREQRMGSPKEWVSIEARKRQALQEGGTLRHTLWRCLQSTVTPLLANMLEVMDRYANMDLLCDQRLSQGLVRLWLDILADSQILDLTSPQKSSESDQEVLVQHYFLLDGEQQGCAAPFSWLVKLHLDQLWEESEFLPVTTEGGTARILQFVSTFNHSRLGSHLRGLSPGEQLDYGHFYLHDFLLLSLKIKSKDQLRVFTRAVLACVSELQTSAGVSPDLSPAWILAAAKHFVPRLDTLSHILLLQPDLAAGVLQQASKREPQEMVEDIVALGVCVEETKLLAVACLKGWESFVSRVEFLQPCLDRALGQKYGALCGPAALQQLDAIRSMWCGMLVVASFIQHVLLKVQQNDRLKELSLKHCNLLLNLMQESPDLRSVETLQQLIRVLNSFHDECISRDLRFGDLCAVCLLEPTEPCVLPCEHIFCRGCLQRCLQTRRSCPKCRTDLPPDFEPAVNHTIKAALEQQAGIRGCCNTFFLEVVSRFCLSEGLKPGEEVVELLFSLLVSANGGVYRTRELTPFLQCVDNSPVVRSVLPKLLLQHSFDQAKAHVQTYLRNLEENLLGREDVPELYLLFVNCFQDCLLFTKVKEVGQRAEQQTPAEISFLSRLARKHTADRRAEPADFLLSTARLRICLSTAAQLLESGVRGRSSGESADQYLSQVRAVCEYGGNDWYRVYLLRALHRLSSMDSVLCLMNTPACRWVFPAELLRLQRMVSSTVDQFLCCGEPYRATRDAVSRVLLENGSESFVTQLQKLKGCQLGVVALALFRLVTCRYRSPHVHVHPSPQETAKLAGLLKHIRSKEFGEFCASLLANQIGGQGSLLRVSTTLSAQRQSLLELLVHLDSVLLSGNPLLACLHQVASQPQNVTNFFLPTMPDDHTSDVRKWLMRERSQMYHCANGHPCVVGECGKPMERSRCLECGVQIGGVDHKPVSGFTRQTVNSDQTRPGHILGDAAQRSEAPERQLTLAQSCLLRLLTHLALLQGAITHQQAVCDMIHPRPPDALTFLWNHLEKDLTVLGQTLDQNMDNTAVTVHLVLNTSTNPTGYRGPVPDLSSRLERQQWEKRVCASAIDPVLHDLKKNLSEAQARIGADDGLAGSPLMNVLFGDPGKMLSLPCNSPTDRSSFWTPPSSVTVERFSHLLGDAKGHDPFPLLTTFLRKIPCVRQLHHLPELAALQSDLLRVFPHATASASQTIAQMLQQIPEGCQKKMLLDRVERFLKVWNNLRAEMANNSADLGVDVTLCEKELTPESTGEFLTPNRHGPGSCLQTLVRFLLEAHNSLVRASRRVSHQEDSDYSVPLERISETQLTLCHPERELLPLVLAHCHYTLKKGEETDTSYDWSGIQAQLSRCFLAGKPLIQEDTSRYVNRHLQDFSVVLSEVRGKICQEPLKGSASSAARTVLRSYTDVCDAVFVVEIGLRFLGKTGGDPQAPLLSFLADSLQMKPQISSTVAKSLGESNLQHSVFTWQLLTCWKSELMLNRQQDPFQKLPPKFQQKLSEEDRKRLKVFLAATDTERFCLELHEILLLKTSNAAPDDGYHPHWDIRSTVEVHLEQKDLPPLLELESLPEELTLGQGADVWRATVAFKRR